MLSILGIFGVESVGLLAWFGMLGPIMAVLTPILRVVAGWVMDALDFLVRRFIKEVKALFDVFPFMVLLLAFLGGGLFFTDKSTVWAKSVEVVTQKRVTPHRRVRQKQTPWVEQLFTDPLSTLGIR